MCWRSTASSTRRIRLGPERIAYGIKALVLWWDKSAVSAVTAATCRRYVKERGVKAATARRELGVLSAALRYCVVEGYLSSAPQVWLPAKGPPRDRWLTRSDVAKLLREACKSPRARLHLPLYILISVYTGAQRDAILSLQWQPNTAGGWVDLKHGVIDFRRPKETNKRRSIIPIPSRLKIFLRQARQRTRQYVLEFEGQPIGDPKKALGTAGQRAGLSHVYSHLLRHTAVTWLVQAGVPLWEVAGWVGMSVEMIERVYGHHSPDRFAAVMKAQR